MFSDDIECFIKAITSIIGFSPDDFWYLGNFYFDRLSRALANQDDQEIKQRLVKMKSRLTLMLLSNDHWTRQTLLTDAQFIDNLLQAHKQDWESKSPEDYLLAVGSPQGYFSPRKSEQTLDDP